MTISNPSPLDRNDYIVSFKRIVFEADVPRKDGEGAKAVSMAVRTNAGRFDKKFKNSVVEQHMIHNERETTSHLPHF